MKMRISAILFSGCCAVACLVPLVAMAAAPAEKGKPKEDFARWEKEISGLEAKADKQKPPSEGIVFVGSSSIRRWDLKKSFGDLPTINSGFGGSQLADSVHFAPRIILPYKPKAVVLYAGDNDLARGKTPEQIAEDYEEFVALIHKSLPETKVVYIAVKPSLSRWKLIDKVRDTNKLIEKQASEGKNQAFVDIDAPMLGEDGKPRQELFAADGLHLSDAGYKIWASLVLPHISTKK